MTIELEKTTKPNGDIFYTILLNGVPSLYSRMYGGNIIRKIKVFEYLKSKQ